MFDPDVLLFLQKKVNFLWSYVDDLADQNQVLVQTIEDLQKEADNKVSNWGMKLPTSDHSLQVRFYKCLKHFGLMK